MKGIGEAAKQSILTFRYIDVSTDKAGKPTKKARWWKEHIPEGMVFTLPQGFAMLLIGIGGIAMLFTFAEAIRKAMDTMSSSKGGWKWSYEGGLRPQ